MVRSTYYAVVERLYNVMGRALPDLLTAVLARVRLAADSCGRNGRRSVYLGHLRRIFPDRSHSWRRAVLADYWRTHQRAMLGLFHAEEMSEADLRSAVEWEGRTELDQAVSEGRGVLLLAPHFGDERTMHIVMARCGYDMHVLSTDYAGAPEAVRRARLSASERTHHMAFPTDNPRWMYRALESGAIVQTAPTGYGGAHGVWIRSFGVPVLAPATFHRLREVTDCALLLAVNHALPGFRYRISLERLRLPGGVEASAQSLFDRITLLGMDTPGQYNWMNLAIRHRETNTIARLGSIPADEHLLEREAVPEDDDPGLVRDAGSLPRSGRVAAGGPAPSSRG